MPAIIANNIALAYDEEGTGFPVICIHGGTSNRRTWRPVRGGLSAHFRVIAYDRRGHGESDRVGFDGPRTVARDTADLLAFMDALGLERAALVGSSYGGVIAIHAARVAPQRVAALVLPEPALVRVLPWFPTEQRVYEAASAFRGDVQRIWQEHGPEAGLDHFLRVMVGPNYEERMPPPALDALRAESATLVPEIAAEESYTITEADLRGMDVPTLLLQGTESPAYFQRVCAVLATLLPNVEHRVMPDAGHIIHLAQPDAFNRAALGFLGGHVSAYPE